MHFSGKINFFHLEAISKSFRLKLLTLFNLFTYFTGCIAMGLLKERIPVDVYHRFSISILKCINFLKQISYNYGNIDLNYCSGDVCVFLF